MDFAYCRSGDIQAYREMRQKSTRDAFFRLQSDSQLQRPASVATEFVDTDWDEEVISEAEDNSPRISLQSSGQPSFTTVSSYDEAPTPRSSRGREACPEHLLKPVEGPRGPHLFRSSTDLSLVEDDFILTLSPISPKAQRGIGDLLDRSAIPRKTSPLQYTHIELNSVPLASWTPEMVAQSMLNAGIELSVADRFIENDINGAILMTLKFEDLRELDIQSFGIRTKVWHQIQTLRDSRPSCPRPATPIEDAPSREARRELRSKGETESSRSQSNKRRARRKLSADEDIVHPMESVSIIGIEQVVPKPHHCSKGEKCSKWRRQQRLLEDFKKAHPTVDAYAGGTVMIYGDAGNPETARAIDPNENFRPVSDAVPSVVASSDVMGPGGLPPLQYLQEATLRGIQARDPQDNVRQFLKFQQKSDSNQVPPTPPFEILPPTKMPHQGLRQLPKLFIPGIPIRAAPSRTSTIPQPTAPQRQELPACQMVQQAQRQATQPAEFAPYRMNKAEPLSPDLGTSRSPYRFGTPFSEMDVPIAAVPVGPVARDASQSVPPDMNYRASPSPRSQSRASSRRPSFPILPSVNEYGVALQTSKTPSPKSSSPIYRVRQQPLRAPPRFNYPWSPASRGKFEDAIPPVSTLQPGADHEAAAVTNGITHQGPMKKRKTRLLRREWQDGYFTLKGTRLNMHKDAREVDRTLEYIDIDDYAIACSSLASTSKLNAAFKAVRISHNCGKSDPVGAFSFQLIPQDKNAGARLRKRDSSINGVNGNAIPSEGVNATGKTHHFAVKSRDDRIDWMRELMLAKAMKQKREGFEISVNGNMI
ncbi:SAM and PH domain-containing protein [Metarhizium album ARSEF 1941]|uniref:SAM and PH domain-containing protein n=1 Tax=Metarhizium album (strain ARSEF 1941) TaxID=1081103 RepID=A0A0B2WQZ5_METAS|nr:SAM and PH domain-containing protein [Metarhizium album ARSEF 1941]KHN96433.1 SAM and PH domain-containing protein [Metarhizium album ARSEF 1941]